MTPLVTYAVRVQTCAQDAVAAEDAFVVAAEGAVAVVADGTDDATAVKVGLQIGVVAASSSSTGFQ